MRARDFERAEEVDDAVDFDLIRHRPARAPPSSSHALADRTDRISWIGTIAVIVVAVVRAHRAARAARPRRPPPRARRRAAARSPSTDSLTGLPNRALLRAADRRGARAPGERRRRRVPRPRRLQAGQRLARPRRRRPAARDLRRASAATRCAPRTPWPGSAATSSRCSAIGAGDPDALVERLFGVLAAPVMLEGKRLHLRASIGIATTDSGSDLLRNADLAMYAAKGSGHEPLRRLHRRHARARAGAAGPPRAARAGDRERGAGPALPADRRPRPRPHRRLRGAGALAASHARPARPGRVHPAGRGDRADRAARALGPARGVPQAAQWAGAPYLSRQRRRSPARAGRASSRRSRCALRDSGLVASRLVLEVTESSSGGRRRGRAPAGAAQARRPARDRRLRHRLLVAGLPAPVPDGRPEDRPLLHAATRARTARCCRRSWPWASRSGLVLVPEGIESPSRPTRCARSAAGSARASCSASPSRRPSSRVSPSRA